MQSCTNEMVLKLEEYKKTEYQIEPSLLNVSAEANVQTEA